MKVAVLYEYSGIMRDAFIARGHDAISCDLLPTERPGPHYQGNVWDFLNLHRYMVWDLVICHPPCTRLCNSGVLRLYNNGKKSQGINPIKWGEMEAAAHEFKLLFDIRTKSLAIENPVMHGHAMKIIGRQPSQSIQPYQFGEDASKRTCLWLVNLLPLTPTSYFPPRIVNGRPRWSNQTDSGQNKLGPSETRGKDRAKTYHGIAEAAASQWGSTTQLHLI